MDFRQKDEQLWGVPIWILFHTLSIKIKPCSFQSIRIDLLKIILTICKNLFCPYCADHAVDYLEKNRFVFINSIEELKDFLFVFHNSVNIKTNKPIFLLDDLKKTYENLNTRDVVGNVLKPNNCFHKNFDIEFIEELRIWFDAHVDDFYN